MNNDNQNEVIPEQEEEGISVFSVIIGIVLSIVATLLMSWCCLALLDFKCGITYTPTDIFWFAVFAWIVKHLFFVRLDE